MDVNEFLQSEVKVVNIGLQGFARDLDGRGVPTVHLDWSPPPANARVRDLLAKLGS